MKNFCFPPTRPKGASSDLCWMLACLQDLSQPDLKDGECAVHAQLFLLHVCVYLLFLSVRGTSRIPHPCLVLDVTVVCAGAGRVFRPVRAPNTSLSARTFCRAP